MNSIPVKRTMLKVTGVYFPEYDRYLELKKH